METAGQARHGWASSLCITWFARAGAVPGAAEPRFDPVVTGDPFALASPGATHFALILVRGLAEEAAGLQWQRRFHARGIPAFLVHVQPMSPAEEAGLLSCLLHLGRQAGPMPLSLDEIQHWAQESTSLAVDYTASIAATGLSDWLRGRIRNKPVRRVLFWLELPSTETDPRLRRDQLALLSEVSAAVTDRPDVLFGYQPSEDAQHRLMWLWDPS